MSLTPNHPEQLAFSERRLRAQLLLARRCPGDTLRLADAVLEAALDGSRALTLFERTALENSPLTMRRLRTLALARRAAMRTQWQGSSGLLRAAADAQALQVLDSDDGCWRLHFVGADSGWRIIVQLRPDAPFAPQLLGAAQPIRVVDGAGTELLAGQLDVDAECEARWPCALAPAAHFQQHGAAFHILPLDT